MQPIAPSRVIALKIWWALFWRSLSIAIGVTLILTTLIGMVMALAGSSVEKLQSSIPVIARAIYTPAFILASIEIIRRVLGKKFRDFQIMIVPRQD